MNSTPHTTFTRVFFPERFAESEAARAEVKRKAADIFVITSNGCRSW